MGSEEVTSRVAEARQETDCLGEGPYGGSSDGSVSDRTEKTFPMDESFSSDADSLTPKSVEGKATKKGKKKKEKKSKAEGKTKDKKEKKGKKSKSEKDGEEKKRKKPKRSKSNDLAEDAGEKKSKKKGK